MSGFKDDPSRARGRGLDPDGTSSSALGERKGIVADKNSGASELEGYVATGKETGRTEFVDDLEDETGCVDSIADDGRVIDGNDELVFAGVRGEGSGESETARDVAVDA